MLDRKRIGVVVPCYNEEDLVGRVLETMPGFVDRIYVVDDASEDASLRCLYDLKKTEPRLHILRHLTNQGVGAATVTGYRRAVADGMDVVAVMAGDAQMDPADLEGVVGPVARGQCDYVKGNRFLFGDCWRVMPRHRYLGSVALRWLTRVASGQWHIDDPQCGYTAISAEAIERLPLDRLYPRYGFGNHILTALKILGLKVAEVPVRPVYHTGPHSSMRLRKVIPSLLWLLLRCWLWRTGERTHGLFQEKQTVRGL